MSQPDHSYIVIGFPIFFAAMWIGVTALCAFMSGWFELVSKFPDRAETALYTVKGQSGTMGMFSVAFNSILNFGVCASGLRVSINRLFGPFTRPFFVPWADISVERKRRFIGPAAILHFGGSETGQLTIPGYLADRLARASAGSWPERGQFPPETARQAFMGVAREWAIITVLASAFFIIAPRLIGPSNGFPPIAVAILFPALFFGLMSVFRYCIRVGR